ncbi:unnamed protein product [Dibothriocephalus latus]|uniref:Uncharacterized protein n=1 Tax=Dibothriocephalus latus TaxID=60516 RepID=A0A3P7NJF8_DIBLA|nr:unnamed protein product [Dibothriocephalus latus]
MGVCVRRECLLALKNHSKVGVFERTEVARIGNMHYQLESLLSNRTDKESSAAFPFLDGAIMTLKNRNASLNVLKEVLASSQKHLEASACFSICEDLSICPGELLRRCGIYPMSLPTSEEEDVNRLIEKLGLSKKVTSEAPALVEMTSKEVIAISRLQRFGLGDTPEANALSMTIICGLHDVRADVEASIEKSISLREEYITDRRHLRYLLVAPEFVSPIELFNEIAAIYAGETKATASLKIGKH